ncbi:RNA polymerase sigma factor [Ochrobactrum quorumnocens]|uniref:RNA polymerase sigma factor n=1 Tax=Ochrobactrum quorumnocens TaxID=271865 RepID=UPI001786D5CF|nr:RNA polymerase sigma factor [Brucella sp. HL-2]MBD7989730.1 RNA polymerase sigma factor [Ochrobactrum gallinarum]MCV9909464.1 RNA polymerase sigma factor [Brucella sp. HL-2]
MWNLQRLFQNHARELNRFFRRRGHNAETAADLTQDTFVRVMSASSSGPSGKDNNPRAYLHQIARNLSIDLYRRERIVEYVNMPDEEWRRVADATPTPETIVYDRQRLMIIEKALLELPEQTRRAFELHRLEEKTIAEVASELGLSVSRTWTLIKRGYVHLRARLLDVSSDT